MSSPQIEHKLTLRIEQINSVFCRLCLELLDRSGIRIEWDGSASESQYPFPVEIHVDLDSIVQRLRNGETVRWARDGNLWAVGLFAVTYVAGDAICYPHFRALPPKN